ncbi:adhesion G protein-coupled receptor A3-like isoform X2 [Rhodnius prolixus]
MLEGLHYLEKLKISQNLIRQIKEGTFDGLLSLKQLDISSNPLLCDCEFWWIGIWSANMSVKLSPSAKCYEPIALRDQSIRKLKTLGQHCSWAEYSQISPLQLTPDNDQVVFEGDSLKLECRAVGALRALAAAVSPPEVSLTWYWAGLAPSNVFPNSVKIDNKTPTDSGMLQSTLVIDQLHSNHTGEWNCELVSSELNHTNTLSVIVISGRTSYCPPTVTKSNKGLYNWPKTVAGHVVDLPCAAEVALGAARYNCTLNATWTELDTVACPYVSETTRILQQYAKMNLSESSKSSILESVKRLHNYTLGNKLSFKDHMDIVFITQTIINYLEFVSSEKEIGTILLDLVSHLMDLEENLLSTAQYQDKSCSKLIQAVEAIAEYSHMSHPYRGWNLAVETFRVARENFLGLTCTWWSGKDRKRDKLFQCSNNKSTVLLTHEKLVEASIQIPESLFRQLEHRGRSSATLQIFFAVYDNGKLFPPINESISSSTTPIVGAKIVGMEVRDLSGPAYVTLGGVGDGASPAWWDQSASQWDSKPCKPSHLVTDLLITECTNLGYFTLAPLMRRHRIIVEQAKSRLSSPVLYVGTFISSTCLLVSAFTYAICRKAINMADKMKHALANSWVSFSMLSIVFSIGIYQTEDVRICQCVGLLLHYLTLTSLFWMAITINVMRRCANSKAEDGGVVAPTTSISSDCSQSGTGAVGVSSQPLTGLYLVGWGVSVLLVGLSGAVNPPGYVTPTYCSIAPRPAFTPVLLPATTIQLFILTTALLVVRTAAVKKDSNAQLSEGTQATDLELLESAAGGGGANGPNNQAITDRTSIHSVVTPSSRIEDTEHSIQLQLKAFLIIFCLFICAWTMAALSVVKPFGFAHEETAFGSLYAVFAIALGAFTVFFYCFSRSDVRAVWFTIKNIKRCRNVTDVSIPPIINSNETRTINSDRKSISPRPAVVTQPLHTAQEIMLNKTNFVDLHRRQYHNNVVNEPNSFYNPHQSIVARKFFKKQRRKRNNLGSNRRAAGDGSASALSPDTSELFHLGSKVNNTNIHVETPLHTISSDDRNILGVDEINQQQRNRWGPSLNERLVIGAESNADSEAVTQPILNNDGSVRYASVASDCCSCIVSEAHSATDCTLRDLTSDQSSRSSHLYAVVAPDMSPPPGRLKIPLQLPDEDKRETSV